jgi:hypothetical protein
VHRTARAEQVETGYGCWMGTRQTPSLAYCVVACLTLVAQAPISGVPANRPAIAQRSDPGGAKPGDSSPPVCVPGWVIDAKGIRRSPDRCLPDARKTAGPLAGVVPVNAGCEPPWFVDSRGIQRIRPECLGPAPARAKVTAPARPPTASYSTPANVPASRTDGCDPPWWLDAKGIRRLKMKCLGAAPARAEVTAPARLPAASQSTSAITPASRTDGCDPPWWLDANGIRRLRPQCL